MTPSATGLTGFFVKNDLLKTGFFVESLDAADSEDADATPRGDYWN
jgi:hypothetical protein